MAEPVWIATESDAVAAISAIREHPVCGYDSEFDGVDISSQSCVGRSRLDVFSIAVPTAVLNPIGYYVPTSWVFEGRLCTIPAVQGYLEDGAFRKVIHNRTVDEHTARNAGVRIRGGLCTLNMARWIYPERANLVRGNFDLDSLSRWRFDLGKTEDFDEFLGYDRYEPYETEVVKKACVACDSADCRKKKSPHDIRMERVVKVVRQKRVRDHHDLRGIRPGHELFHRYLYYAAVDAELALILYQMMLIDGQKERPYPWGL